MNGQLLTPRQDVQYVPNAGLLIRQVTKEDAGFYYVHVNLHNRTGYINTHTRSVNVVVASAPKMSDGKLHVQTKRGAAVDNRTGQWSMELECGHFTSLGQPPVIVDWTTPAGKTYNSSYYTNGTFVLTLTNPIDSGNYSCQLSRDSPVGMCVSEDKLVSSKASMYVDGNELKLTLLEVSQKQLQKLADVLKTENAVLRRDNDLLSNQTRDCLVAKDRCEGIVGALSNSTRFCATKRALLETKLYEQTRVYQQKTKRLAVTAEECRAQLETLKKELKYHPENCMDIMEYNTTSGVYTLYPRGLDNLYTLTSANRYELRVDLTDWEGNKAYARYGNSMRFEKGREFSTKDADHDTSGNSCAIQYHGAWWYSDCYFSNLNGDYKPTSRAPRQDGLSWYTLQGDYYSMKFTEMKIRPSSLN
nr:hypothetical protein BaRGS_031265 [Batillaria attramentaria]